MASLNTLFAKKTNKVIGVDISSSAVKLLELSRKGSRYQVVAFAVEPLAPGAITDKQINDPKPVGEAIARALAKAKTRTRDAAVAVAGTAVITKIIEMPQSLAGDEMEAQIKAEADQYIPYPIDEVNLDFEIVGPNSKRPENVDVVLAACRKETVERLCAAADLAGLKPRIVDVEAYALENACQFLTHQMPDGGRGRTIAVIDMGTTSTSLLVLRDLKTIYTRDTAFGSRQLTEEIMRSYELSQDEALRGRRQNSLPEGYEDIVLSPFINDMVQQIDRALQFFFSSATQFSSIDQIILAGGCAHIAGADAIIAERLQTPTVVAKPFAHMDIAPRANASALAQDEAALLIACGLAYRAFDEEKS